jgi:sugar O-acyltransferase (sialic acid O-acetyltransferase NeuD family)
MKKLAIIGSGALGIQVAWHALSTGEYCIAGFFDDSKSEGSAVGNYHILGAIDSIETAYEHSVFDYLFIAIGYNHMTVRSELFQRFHPRIPFATIIHPTSFVDPSASIGTGSILYPGCIVDMDVSIGNNVLLNLNCTIAHDTSIGNHCFLSPSVSLAGFVQIASNVVLGIGSIVIDSIIISENIRTGAGAVVTKSIQDKGLYVGIPAKKIK